MDNSFVRERRGISWRDQTLASISAPPMPLMVVFGVVILLMYLASYSDYKAQVERRMTGLKLLLFLLPVLLILMVHLMMVSNRWFYVGGVRPVSESINQEGSSPCGLILVVLLLLVLVYYQSSFQSSWFRAV
ncbi:hypothetical protein ACH5RR_035238 [Cinchona calisaya]|uniref:Transmembrane protein n=1 Tax=Cinchona calisaya TaxID=153742 RepID=A0ABD2YHP4_9GENT